MSHTTPKPSLRQKAVRGLKLASAATAGKTLIDVVAQLALARLLMPEHFGVFATAQALTGFVSCLTDFAGLKFLIREEKTERGIVSSVFWFELLLGILVACLWCLLAAPVLEAIGKPEQVVFARALGLWIVAERFMLPRALHDHAMRFGPVNKCMLAGVAAGSAALIACAVAGLGPWTFVVGLITRTIVTAAWMWKAAGFIPAITFDTAVIRRLLPFGAPLMLTTAITFAYTNIDYVIVGWLLGDHTLGIYYASYRYPHYLIQFNIILNSVVFPAFARAEDREQIARGLRYVTRYAGALAFPAAIAMWAEGPALIYWLLGDPVKWSGALFPFQVFTTLAALRLTFTHWGHVFVVHGNTRPLLYAALFNLPAITIGVLLGARYYGIEGAAVAVATISWGTIAFCCFVVMKRVLAYSYLDALSPVLKAAAASILTFTVLKYLTPDTHWAAALRLLLGLGVYATVAASLCASEITALYRNRA